ncbi:hypothetical protein B0O80DRAFT_439697 [Mortierella sp. GBAus27b]|nr:hypothetical protein BGX31_004856 [Mortierella sp. GBA43]KAI8360616.1 hypothetical protein B0O80DRAFT_439697 [Mortierella sp. GBAus27b]
MSTIPEECLWLIVSHLRHERATLRALLLTSSELFRIAVSFLYASPFRLLDQERNLHWTSVQRLKKYDALVHLLLHSSQLHPDTARDAARVLSLPRYGPEVPKLPTPSTVDYLSYYTDMFHDPMMHQTFITLFPSVPNCYLANVIWYREMVEIRNKIELAMMDHVMPQVTTLAVSMPLQVPRAKLPLMTNLRRLEVLGTDFCLLDDYKLEWGKSAQPVNNAPKHAMTRLDKMLTFIWDHQRMFGTLRELKIENKEVSEQPDSQLVGLVEAMGHRLEVLDVRFWHRAGLYLDRFPTQHLRCLLLRPNKGAELRLEESGNMATFLSNCPNLEEIQLYTGEKDLLKAWRPRNRVETGRTPVLHNQHREMRKMKRISIAGVAHNVISIANEAAELFATTLEALVVRSWFGGKIFDVPISWSGCTLARLTNLDLEGEVAWTFDFSSVLNCPRLSRVRLAFTGPMPSRSAKKQPAINYLEQVCTLQDLELVGTWVTLVNRGWPAVIAKMYHLERLDLRACDISADEVVKVVRDAIEQSARWRLQSETSHDSSIKDGKESSQAKPPIANEYLYRYCRLQWVIVSKGLEGEVIYLWSEWRKRLEAKQLRYQSASAERVHFSFVSARS